MRFELTDIDQQDPRWHARMMRESGLALSRLVMSALNKLRAVDPAMADTMARAYDLSYPLAMNTVEATTPKPMGRGDKQDMTCFLWNIERQYATTRLGEPVDTIARDWDEAIAYDEARNASRAAQLAYLKSIPGRYNPPMTAQSDLTPFDRARKADQAFVAAWELGLPAGTTVADIDQSFGPATGMYSLRPVCAAIIKCDNEASTYASCCGNVLCSGCAVAGMDVGVCSGCGDVQFRITTPVVEDIRPVSAHPAYDAQVAAAGVDPAPGWTELGDREVFSLPRSEPDTIIGDFRLTCGEMVIAYWNGAGYSPIRGLEDEIWCPVHGWERREKLVPRYGVLVEYWDDAEGRVLLVMGDVTTQHEAVALRQSLEADERYDIYSVVPLYASLSDV